MAVHELPDLRYRVGRVDDLGYVIRTYVHGYRGALTARCLHPDEFHARIREQAVRLLERPAARLYVACDSVDENIILGFALAEHTCLHWADVRREWRGLGIARGLLAQHATPVDRYSAWTAELKPGKLPATWAYDPHAAVWPWWADTVPERRQTRRRQNARALETAK